MNEGTEDIIPPAETSRFAVVYIVDGGSVSGILENTLMSLRQHMTADAYVYCTVSTEQLIRPLAEKYSIKIITGVIDGEIEGYSEYGTVPFNLVCSQKAKIISHTLRLGYDFVVYSDFDVVVLDDFGPYLEKASRSYPIGAQSECRRSFPPNYCCGFMYFNNSDYSYSLLSELSARNAKVIETANDQEVFNEAVQRDDLGILQNIWTLPETLFANGLQYRHFLTGREFDLVGEIRPFVFHANWVIGLEKKIQLLRAVNLWFQQPSLAT
jgi:hypothetical protein